jgi:hypothetical protein
MVDLVWICYGPTQSAYSDLVSRSRSRARFSPCTSARAWETDSVQLVANGPNIPDTLLHAHEEDDVVFFCGAGISCPAGLPLFRGLVEGIYNRLGRPKSPDEDCACKKKRFDLALELLEARLQAGHPEVRRALASVLEIEETSAPVETHAALLRLSQLRDGRVRLVTTNFDRLFEAASIRESIPLKSCAAPLLPAPRKNSWDSLVYLHGLLPKRNNAEVDDATLRRLVVTSGDFGRAYLVERWAARFLSELFRTHRVCFVGYSLDDPVLRYMMDALSADRRRGDGEIRAWAFVGENERNFDRAEREWEAKGTIPILYRTDASGDSHELLHSTLRRWSEQYRDGISGKARLVSEYAYMQPSLSTKEDDFVGRMVWALSHGSGVPARTLAELTPAPLLEWLFCALCERRFGGQDRQRFGLSEPKETDQRQNFSLIDRPAYGDIAPQLGLVQLRGHSWLDEPLTWIAQWLVRYMGDPRLLYWIIRSRGAVHPVWAEQLQRHLDLITRLEREDPTRELDRIRRESPDAIPNQRLRTLWRLLLDGHISSLPRVLGLREWLERLKLEGLTTPLRLAIRRLLRPRLSIDPPDPQAVLPQGDSSDIDGPRLRADLVLATEHAGHFLAERDDETWKGALPELLSEFQQLLLDGLFLLREVGEADERIDPSIWHLPSIIPHPQNRDFYDWVVLIELIRDSWLALRASDCARAVRVACDWISIPFLSFKRLSLFAASQDAAIADDCWVEWLTREDSWLLWSPEAKREVMRILVSRAGTLAQLPREYLEDAILRGPPQSHAFSDDEASELAACRDRAIWLRLSKLEAGGGQLGAAAAARLNAIKARHPGWVLRPDYSDEFRSWITVSSEPFDVTCRQEFSAPRNWKELGALVGLPASEVEESLRSHWKRQSREHPLQCCVVLRRRTEQKECPIWAWRTALAEWSTPSLPPKVHREVFRLIESLPEDAFRELLRELARWVSATAKGDQPDRQCVVDLCSRLLDADLLDNGAEQQYGNQPVDDAINHPVGQITEALLDSFFSTKPSANSSLPRELRDIFARFFNPKSGVFRHARVILASRIPGLYSVDRDWTIEHLLPLLDWSASESQAAAAWRGFLWSPRITPDLFSAIRTALFATSAHYLSLGESARQYAGILTLLALNYRHETATSDLRASFEKLPDEGLSQSAWTIWRQFKSDGEQRHLYWKNRGETFFKEVWPDPPRNGPSQSVSDSLARVLVSTGDEFPQAMSTLRSWLVKLDDADFVLREALASRLPNRFPQQALDLAHLIVGPNSWGPHALPVFLDEVLNALPSIGENSAYRALREECLRRNL